MSSRGTWRSRLSPFPVIARNVAISVFHSQQTEKREIASQARNDKCSCHREERSNLAFPQPANREKRDCFAGSQPRKGALTGIYRATLASMCHREARSDIGCHLFLSLRGTKQSRLSTASKQKKERLPRCARNDRINHATLATPQGGFDKKTALRTTR